jgi:hypothetical protein
MPPFPTIHLDSNDPKREVDLIVNNDNLGDRNLAKRKERLEGLSAPVHKGLGLYETP